MDPKDVRQFMQQKRGNDLKELEIYLHIPFCVKKCAYCDFLSSPESRDIQETYVEALKYEIGQFPYKKDYCVSSVFFGGGTPSLLPAGWIDDILNELFRSFSFSACPEISIECNPGTADGEKLHSYRKMGINRISFGLQSSEDRELKLLGRIHTWEDFLHTYESARREGFDNMNVDLMSALPGQTVHSWERTLERVLHLSPEHISAYSLIIEEGTPFYDRYGKDALRREQGEQPLFLPSEEEERSMYRLTEELLLEAGMYRYEISNYALPGRECRHNIGYWMGTEYVGFGLGASSLLAIPDRPAADGSSEDGILHVAHDTDGTAADDRYARFKNTENLADYNRKDFHAREKEVLSMEERMEEFMFLGLRMMNGVSEQEFQKRFNRPVDDVYGAVLRKLVSQELIRRQGGMISLTARGIDLSNPVMAQFLLS